MKSMPIETYLYTRVADPDPVGSGVFEWIRIRIRFSKFSGSGSGFQISKDPDPVFKFLWIGVRFQPRFWNKKKLQKGL